MNSDKVGEEKNAEVIQLDTPYIRKEAENEAKMQQIVAEYNAELQEISDAFDGDLPAALKYYSKMMKSPDKEIRNIAQTKWARCVIATAREPETKPTIAPT
jgi:hypothetical protein